MTAADGRIVGLRGALLAAAPLLSALPGPARVWCPDPADAARLRALAGELGLPPMPTVTDPGVLGPFERVLSDHLDVPARAGITGDSAATDFSALVRHSTVRTADGITVDACTAGEPTRPAVLIASACGMPARLAEGWVRRLARDHFVVVPQTRGLFGGPVPAGLATGVPVQADDLITVLDHLGVGAAHVLGLCGGAVLAVVAAARHPHRVSSLSLWHGDFDLGGDSAKTDHQRNLQALLEMGARGERQASAVHAVLAHTMLGVAPPRLAHLVVYPYVRPDLLHLYCRLNGAIMATDLRPYLDRLHHRTLVVTSADDHTAHPDGSRAVAARLPGSTLHVTDHGDHLSLFGADDRLVDLAARFLAG